MSYSADYARELEKSNRKLRAENEMLRFKVEHLSNEVCILRKQLAQAVPVANPERINNGTQIYRTNK